MCSSDLITDEDPNRVENGFIAQEVEAALIKSGLPTDGIIGKNEKGYYGLRYNDFIPVLVKGMQEQQIIIEDLKKQLAVIKADNPEKKLTELQDQIDELKKLIEQKNK